MKKIVLITVSLLSSVICLSQDLVNTETLNEGNTTRLYSFDRSDKSVQGTPYIEDIFLPAKISAGDGEIFQLRYNAVSDEMEIIGNDKNSTQAINKNIDGISITFLSNNKTYKVYNYINNSGIVNRGYFIDLSNTNSDIKLLIKESKVYVKRKPALNSYQETKPAQFKREDDTYYILSNNTAQELPKKGKDIAGLFPEHTKTILTYIKSEKIKTNREEDLIKLVNYINTL